MLQGPMGFGQKTGKISKLISYSYYSPLHNQVLPKVKTAEPQVAYIDLDAQMAPLEESLKVTFNVSGIATLTLA